MLLKVNHIIYELYVSHEYLLKSPYLSDSQKALFQKFLSKEFDIAEAKSSLKILSRFLHTHFQRKVIILIDEYDTPLNDWYALHLGRESGTSMENDAYFQNVLSLFRDILSEGLKDNVYLEKGVVTGILRIPKASLFSGLNNLGENSVLDENYSPYFGFTEEEVNMLLHTSGMDKTPETAKTLKSWYNGYNIRGVTIYNPWSIMNCIYNKGALKAYWVGTASMTLIERALILDKLQKEIQCLIKGESIEMTADPKMVFADITSSPSALYSLLLFSGYLTAHSIEMGKAGTYNCKVSIPNQEILEVFETSSLQWISQKFHIEPQEYSAFLEYLLGGDIATFSQKLKEYLQISASFFATSPKNGELFYNGFIMGLICAVSSRYLVEAEKESGSGRADLILLPKSTARYKNALILEFKFANSGEDLVGLAQKALEQIETKNYAAKIKGQENIERILKVGLAFGGKDVEVAQR